MTHARSALLFLPLAAAGAVLLARPVLQGPRPAFAAEAAAASDVDRKLAQLLPTAAEDRWLQIPWRDNVMAARKEAQQQGKPLFLWVMDGNPLGCG